MARPQITDIVSQIEADEGFSPIAIPDTTHYQFGFGFNWITRPESVTILNGRIAPLTHDLIAALPWAGSLSEPRLGVLQNMSYNMGLEELLKWTTFLELMEKGDFSGAADDLEHNNPKYVAEVGERAHRLAEQLRTDLWQ